MLTPMSQKKTTSWRADRRPIRTPTNSRQAVRKGEATSLPMNPSSGTYQGHNRTNISIKTLEGLAGDASTQPDVGSIELPVRPPVIIKPIRASPGRLPLFSLTLSSLARLGLFHMVLCSLLKEVISGASLVWH